MNLEGKQILVTGAAGFIGAALVDELLDNKSYVIGFDNINNYYSKDLKKARLQKKYLIKKEKINAKWDFHL